MHAIVEFSTARRYALGSGLQAVYPDSILPSMGENPDLGTSTQTGDSVTQACAAPSAPADRALPCPYRQAHLLQQAISPDKMRVGFFLGAGCPTAIRVPNGSGTKALIDDIKGLTETIRTKMSRSSDHKEQFATILKHLKDSEVNKVNVEQILTRVRSLADAIGEEPYEKLTKKNLEALDETLCREIGEVMKVRLPSRDTPYHQLASWIGSIPRKHPVEVFTTNYDLLMEQALEETSVPYFDGFSGSDRTFFDVPSMEQHDKLPWRWARLWKVHGSINWWKHENSVQRREKGETGATMMIYPTHLKYIQSRVMPYLAMLDRLRAFLANGQAVMITCGYSFADDHINQAIAQGLSGNPTAVCFGLVYEDRARAVSLLEKVGIPGNLRLLAVDGGVLGTISRDWHCKPKPEDAEFHGTAVNHGALNSNRTKAPDERCKLLLGDFKSLGEFLAADLQRRGQGSGDEA